MELPENVLVDSAPSNSKTEVTLNIAYKQLWLIGTENSRNLVMGIPSFFPGHKSLSLKMMNKENSEMNSD